MCISKTSGYRPAYDLDDAPVRFVDLLDPEALDGYATDLRDSNNRLIEKLEN